MTDKNSKFHKLLQEQIGHELSSSNQYLAMYIHYDAMDMPQMAEVFKQHSLEEREHAMLMIQYLLESDLPVQVPAIDEVRNDFSGIAEPVAFALEAEKFVTEKITALARVARDSYDFTGESFIRGFIDEQLEEESYFNRLLTVVERDGATTFEVENWVAREISGGLSSPNLNPSGN